jgi:hypothetical protein
VQAFRFGGQQYSQGHRYDRRTTHPGEPDLSSSINISVLNGFTYLPTIFFLCALFGKFYAQSVLFKKKIPCPLSFSVLDKTLIFIEEDRSGSPG